MQVHQQTCTPRRMCIHVCFVSDVDWPPPFMSPYKANMQAESLVFCHLDGRRRIGKQRLTRICCRVARCFPPITAQRRCRLLRQLLSVWFSVSSVESELPTLSSSMRGLGSFGCHTYRPASICQKVQNFFGSAHVVTMFVQALLSHMAGHLDCHVHGAEGRMTHIQQIIFLNLDLEPGVLKIKSLQGIATLPNLSSLVLQHQKQWTLKNVTVSIHLLIE